MSNSTKNGLKVWTPLLFSLIMVLGMIFGYNLHDSLRNKWDFQNAIHQPDRLEEIIHLVKEKYVDTVNTEDLYNDGVNGILKRLDPHTSYISPDELQSVNESLEGGFYGIGIEFAQIRDTIRVVHVIAGGASEKAGVKMGDMIVDVNGKIVAGAHLPTDSIIHLLRGKQHTVVSVGFITPFDTTIKLLKITRDEVPLYSIEANMMLDSITGYIKINRFSATTYHEFHTALLKLKNKGLQQLIIDVRDNPGGYLDAVTGVADELLKENLMIAYTKGIHSAKTEYKTANQGLFEQGRLAILVNESSASASEILAGAIQDWDRGVVLGRRTFGKGLVQEQYDLSGGAALRLTVAKYFTPSGRCIQRSFAKGKFAYMHDFEKRLEDEDSNPSDSLEVPDTTRYYTSTHRTVYGGGGILPDSLVSFDTARISHMALAVALSEDMRNIIWDQYILDRQQHNYANINAFVQQFKSEDLIIKKYFSTVDKDSKNVSFTSLKKPANMAYLRLQVKAQMARLYFQDNGFYAVMNPSDNVLQTALKTLY